MKKTRVVHIVEAFEGGILTYMRTVLPRLVDCGYDVTLICSLDRKWVALPDAVREFETAGVTVHVVSMSRKVNLLSDVLSLMEVRRILSAGKFDIVHTHGSKGGALGRITAKLAGIRTVLHTPHCFAFLRNGGRLRRWTYLNFERFLGRITHMLIGVSRDEARIAMKRGIVPAAKCSYVNNALDDLPEATVDRDDQERASLKESFGISRNARVVSFIGRLVEYKGIWEFLEAAEISRDPDAVFAVAGDGELRPKVIQRIRERGLDQKIRLLGHVNNIDDLYTVSDVIVACSRAEGQPYCLLEAMRIGRAIVATAVPGNRSLIHHGKTGHLVSKDVGTIAAAVDLLLDNKDMREELAANARREFLNSHRAQEQVLKLKKLYDRCSSVAQ